MTPVESDSSALKSCVAFTGRLACMTRAEAFEVIRQRGGNAQRSDQKVGRLALRVRSRALRARAREKSLKNFRLVPLRRRYVQRRRALAVIMPIMPTSELVCWGGMEQRDGIVDLGQRLA